MFAEYLCYMVSRGEICPCSIELSLDETGMSHKSIYEVELM